MSRSSTICPAPLATTVPTSYLRAKKRLFDDAVYHAVLSISLAASVNLARGCLHARSRF